MNLRPILQYIALTLVNCTEMCAVDYFNTELSGPVSFVLLSLTWCAYLEFAVGGILFRPDSQNNKTFQPMGLVQQLDWPLTKCAAWYPSFWDLNYYMVMFGSAGTYTVWSYF